MGNNINMNLKEIGRDVVDLIPLAYDSDPWRALVNAARNILTDLVTIITPRRS
jgi:hypothetical protein